MLLTMLNKHQRCHKDQSANIYNMLGEMSIMNQSYITNNFLTHSSIFQHYAGEIDFTVLRNDYNNEQTGVT